MDQHEKSYLQSPETGNAEETQSIVDYYDILNVSKDATFKQIRESYFSLKNTYNSSNQAMYSLLEEGDIEDSVGAINEAYAVIGNPECRLEYDRRLVAAGLVSEDQIRRDIFPDPLVEKHSLNMRASRVGGARAIDRSDGFANLGFTQKLEGAHSFQEEMKHKIMLGNYSDPVGNIGLGTSQTLPLGNKTCRKTMAQDALDAEIQEKVSQLIADGDLGDGSLYKRIRQLMGVTKEQMQDHIKISIGYIEHLEENRFDLLPQPVYVKGFLKSYLRFLGVSACDRLVKAYVERLNDWTEKKS